MNFINLKIKICLAKEELQISNDEVFISEEDVTWLTKEVKELNYFGKCDSNWSYIKNVDIMKSKQPFKVMDEPQSESDDSPEFQSMTEWDWDWVNKLKNEILSQLTKSIETFTEDESSKSKSFIKEEVLNWFNQLSEILIKEVKQSLDSNAS